MRTATVQGLKAVVKTFVPERARVNLILSLEMLQVCSELIGHGEIDDAMSVLGKLVTKDHDAPVEVAAKARRMLAVCKHLKRSGLLDEVTPYGQMMDQLELGTAWGDDSLPAGVLVRRCEGASDALVVFTPHEGDFWISLDLLHQYLRPFPWHIVYVRDDRGCFHMAGLNGLAEDYAGCVERLAALLERLEVRHTYCMGGSAGGYSALRYGLDLGARAVMSFSGPTSLVPTGWTEANKKHLAAIQAAAPHMSQDLRPLYRQAAARPRAILCYGEQRPDDRDQAERMGGIDGVELMPVKGYDNHDTISYMVVGRKMDQIHGWLTGNGHAAVQ